MQQRRLTILQSIVDEHIATGEPVGSKNLSDFLGFSSATIRSEMAKLESEGYIFQPHTSAGRVPTQKGYRAYVNLVIPSSETLNTEYIRQFAESRGIEKILKIISVISGGNTAFCVTPDALFTTGLAATLSQPDFTEQEKTIRFAQLIDNLSDFVSSIEFDQGAMLKTYIGTENPYKFAQDFAAIVAYFPFSAKPCVLGVLGPMRIPYKKIIPYLMSLGEAFKQQRLLEQ
ncbi:MAG: hypothetical protein WC045_02605 [Patescibacteria group bacterium]